MKLKDNKCYNKLVEKYSKRVLIVEDDQFIRELYVEVLTEAGFVTSFVTNGEEALNKIEESGPYDVILLDVMMPKRDGISFLRAAKNLSPSKLKDTIIILLTNLAHDPVIKDALNLGAKDFLIKSDITPDQLVAKVKSFFP